MRLTPGWMVVVLVLAVVGFLSVFAHGLSAASCADPDALQSAGLYDKARASYEAILDDEEGSECAVKGLWKVAARMCVQADRIAKEPDAYEEAAKAYVSILAFQPLDEDTRPDSQADDDPMQCALDGLKKVREEKPEPPCPSTCKERDDPEPKNDPDPDNPEPKNDPDPNDGEPRNDPDPNDGEPKNDPDPDDPEPKNDPDPDDGPGSCSHHRDCPWTF